MRRGGFLVLVKRTAKYEVLGKGEPTVLGEIISLGRGGPAETLFSRGLLHSFASSERHTQDAVRKLFGAFKPPAAAR